MRLHIKAPIVGILCLATVSSFNPFDTSVPLPTFQPSVQTSLQDMVTIPAGTFTMGSSDADIQAAVAECNDTEKHCKEQWFRSEKRMNPTVWVDTFKIGKYEVTNGQYNICVDAGVCLPSGQNMPPPDSMTEVAGRFSLDNFPVVTVTLQDARIFCAWAGGRLPTEEEWEKAARGVSDHRRYPWGDKYDLSRANFSSSLTMPVGTYPEGASPFGIMDMSGNVFEWTSTDVNGKYVVRGGSWKKFYFRGRVTDRGTQLPPNFANFDIGFRCASE